MTPVFADLIVGGYSLVNVLIVIIVIAACVAILCIALKKFNITIPSFVVEIFWVVVVACVAILAIRFVATM